MGFPSLSRPKDSEGEFLNANNFLSLVTASLLCLISCFFLCVFAACIRVLFHSGDVRFLVSSGLYFTTVCRISFFFFFFFFFFGHEVCVIL